MKSFDPEYNDVMLDVWELRKRGWTEPMITKLLGEPDWVLSGWGNLSKRAYRAAYVEAIEAGSLFRDEFLASARRRRLGERVVMEVLERSMGLEQAGAIAIWQNHAEAMRLAHERELEEGRLEPQAEAAGRRPARRPASKLVCCVDIEGPLADLSICIRFMRRKGTDRVYCEETPSVKAERGTAGTPVEAVANLLPSVLFTLMRFGGPLSFASPGLVDGRMFAEVVEELATRSAKIREGNLEQAHMAIVTKARELSLTPEPSLMASGFWDARCPGTQHGLLLNTSRNEFWCGYCNRSGDFDALRSFADERKK